MRRTPLHSLEHAIDRFARRRLLAGTAVGVAALLFACGLSLRDWPVPRVHDEFSYLLAAETFAEGRITNSTHPHWPHFETFHVLQQPTYQSKYPPGQGLALAVGLLLADEAIVGAWISSALACAAIYWMLLAWTTPRWALIGGLLAALHLGIVGQWSQSYWGGSVVLLGGALALGGLRRAVEEGRARDGVACALGFTILAHSRPYEGLWLALACVLAFPLLVRWTAVARWRSLRAWIRPAVSFTVVGIVGLLSVAYYNFQVTGDPFLFPHRLWSETSPLYPQVSEAQARLASYTGSDPRNLVSRAGRLAWFYVDAALLLPFLALPWLPSGSRRLRVGVLAALVAFLIAALTIPLSLLERVGLVSGLLLVQAFRVLWRARDRWLLFAVITAVTISAISLTLTRGWPHYIAPVGALWIYLVVQALRLARARLGRTNRFWRWSTLVVLLAALSAAAWEVRYAEPSEGWANDRARLVEALESGGMDHLIFVRYPPGYPLVAEWVYNAPGIETSSVVWAHELDDERNRELAEHLRKRCVWLLSPDPESWRGSEGKSWSERVRLTPNTTSSFGAGSCKRPPGLDEGGY